MPDLWTPNWPETRKHFEAWWEGEGLVLGSWGSGLPTQRAHANVPEPPAPIDATATHTDASFIACSIRHKMAHRAWPADILPAAWPHIGTLPLATYLGATPQYAPNNVWYQPCMTDLNEHPPLRFDAQHPQVSQLESIVRETVKVAQGNYFVGMPALLGGLDVLAEVRGTSDLLMDMIENSESVHRRLREIQSAYVQAFDRMYDLVKLDDGSMCFGYFMLWGRGKVGLCQCDTAALFSPEMFGQFVIPYLREQCAYLDRSMFHLDGSQCLAHVDQLLEVDGLDAIEYTPDPKVPGGGDSCWYPLYRRILEAGKAVWVANLRKQEVIPLLDAIGARGVYVNAVGLNEAEAQALADAVEPYRTRG